MAENKDFNEQLYSILSPINQAVKGLEGIALKELFERRLQELDLSQNQVEKLLNIERKSLVGILDRTAKRVDVLNVMKLCSFLNLHPDDYLKLYLTEMPSEAFGELEQVKKSNYIVSNFDLANL